MDFEWDPGKAAANFAKHRVRFADAVTIFEGTTEEERWITLGMDALGRLLVVVYTWRGERIRLISARSATPREIRPIRGKAMRREYDFSKGKRGPVMPVPKGKTRITIRLDDDIVEWFRRQEERAGGGNYQSLINDALRQHIRRAQEPLEATLRRVIREELTHAS